MLITPRVWAVPDPCWTRTAPTTCQSNAPCASACAYSPSTYTLTAFHVATSCQSRYAAIGAARVTD